MFLAVTTAQAQGAVSTATINFNDNSVIEISGTVRNTTFSQLNGKVILSLYNDAEIIDVRVIDNVSVPADGMKILKETFVNNYNTQNFSAKVMFWEQLVNPKPLGNAVSKSVDLGNISGINQLQNGTITADYMLVINTANPTYLNDTDYIDNPINTTITQNTGPLPVYSGINPVMYNFNKVEPDKIQQRYVHMDSVERPTFKSVDEPFQQAVQYSTYGYSTFTVENIQTREDYDITADLKYIGNYCTVWVQQGNAQFEDSMAQLVANEFDNNIYPMMITNFGEAGDADGDGKVALLFYDIQDGFNGDEVTSYVGGYFSPRELYYGLDILHLDTYPTFGYQVTPNIERSYSTIVHELQHLINFTDWCITDQQWELDLWLNEGMSMAAEHMYNPQSESVTDRVSYAINNNEIKNGRSLIDWSANDSTILANYSLSYLFCQYLKTQTQHLNGGGDQIFKAILQSNKSDYRVVEEALQNLGITTTFSDFVTNFILASHLNQTDGKLGYVGQFSSLGLPVYSPVDGNYGLNLVGQGAVLVRLSEPFTPATAGPDIKFIGLNKN